MARVTVGFAVRIAVLSALVLGTGYWLFGDTVRYHTSLPGRQPLRFSFWGSYEDFAMWKDVTGAFQRQTGIDVQLEYTPTRYEQKIQQLMVAGAAPDVILYQDEPFPAVVDDRMFEDLTPMLRTDPEYGPKITAAGGDAYAALDRVFANTMVESFGRYQEATRGGKAGAGPQAGARTWHQYGMPVFGGCNLIYYNREAFRKAGIRVEA